MQEEPFPLARTWRHVEPNTDTWFSRYARGDSRLFKPFLLAVNGLGVGIGATVCGLADFTYIAEGTRLRTPFLRWAFAEAASLSHSPT